MKIEIRKRKPTYQEIEKAIGYKIKSMTRYGSNDEEGHQKGDVDIDVEAEGLDSTHIQVLQTKLAKLLQQGD